jgi:gamma-glutamyl-gamma-aminobutyrate hydrolase PuuD
MRPAIGICAAVERARWGPWDAEVALMPLTYSRAVQAAGGLALVLPPDPAAGAERLAVKSHHHQALERLGEGLVASGWSVPDDVVEAVEMPGHPYALGVLWHPEEDTRSRVIGAMVDAAQAAPRIPASGESPVAHAPSEEAAR